MTIQEENKDLFEYADEMPLAHCISSDYVMGAGIAVPMAEKFNLRPVLEKLGKNKYPDCIYMNNVFSLVTKKYASDKPSYENFEKSLWKMKKIVKFFNIKQVAMPRIGCGLDQLEWRVVKKIIEKIFIDTDLKIFVCYL